MTKKNTKDIMDTFTESFPLLQAIYDIYDLTPNISEDPDNTLRRSVEMTTLELLELTVMAKRQSQPNKEFTLRQCLNKLDTILVFVDLAKQTSHVSKDQADDILKKVKVVSEMIEGWQDKLTQ